MLCPEEFERERTPVDVVLIAYGCGLGLTGPEEEDGVSGVMGTEDDEVAGAEGIDWECASAGEDVIIAVMMRIVVKQCQKS